MKHRSPIFTLLGLVFLAASVWLGFQAFNMPVTLDLPAYTEGAGGTQSVVNMQLLHIQRLTMDASFILFTLGFLMLAAAAIIATLEGEAGPLD
jgi:uncharacterized membrane protein